MTLYLSDMHMLRSIYMYTVSSRRQERIAKKRVMQPSPFVKFGILPIFIIIF